MVYEIIPTYCNWVVFHPQQIPSATGSRVFFHCSFHQPTQGLKIQKKKWPHLFGEPVHRHKFQPPKKDGSRKHDNP